MGEGPNEPENWELALARADAAPRCGARRRRDGQPCCAPAMPNGRCHKHGGASTGPKTAEGLERCRDAPLRHGQRSAEARSAAAERASARSFLKQLKGSLKA